MSNSFQLNDGNAIPAIGLGTWPLKGQSCVRAVESGIATGYTLIDSAMNYDNEAAVGEGIRRSKVEREELFVASKLPGRWHQKELALSAIEESLLRMRLDYLDLYLIHWPNPKRGEFASAWEGLVEARERGLVRSVGVCNFTPDLLDTVIQETGVVPAVNQIEVFPYWSKPEIREYHQQHGILTEGWSPLGRGGDLLEHAEVAAVAGHHGVTSAQVILRWAHQHSVVPLPKSANPERQRSNLDIFSFSLSDREMSVLDQLEGSRADIAPSDPHNYEQL